MTPFLAAVVLLSCSGSTETANTMFVPMEANETGIDFENKLEYNKDFNIYTYRNFYNGGGVAIGDVNNDGLVDIYFTANQLSNRLYMNKGAWSFEDVTESAGVGGKRSWSTGVSMVDINADGWLDIYVCNSGDVKGDNKQNEFFINRKDGSFEDKAAEMGLADIGYSTQTSFFDYDRDGDLDVYLLNNSFQAIGSFNLTRNQRPVRDSLGGHKLFRNDNGLFTDVSESAGIYGSVIAFGLGVAVSDLDKDGWPDIYVSNDFFERDYIYMNNKDGTFREELEQQMPSISVASMGSDIADLDGDALPEIFVTEMLPRDEERLKTTMTFENWDRYRYAVNNGYHHQFTRNMLHRNNGVFPGRGLTFTEVGRMSGVEATDWSWSALFADLDNDGFKDLHVTNGIAQDILNQDYLTYIASEEVSRSVITKNGVDFKKLIDIIPSTKIPNYCFRGGDQLLFTDVTKDWGLSIPGHSNGAAYADLDNDGDLDLVINNVNMPSFLYKNNSERLNPSNAYLKVTLKGTKSNLSGIGSKVTLWAKGKLFYQEQFLSRGFESSVDPRLNFGLGNVSIIDSLKVEWAGGNISVLTNVKPNQAVVIDETESVTAPSLSIPPVLKPLLQPALKNSIEFSHTENQYIDFNNNRLLFHMISTEGPKVATGDVNRDGLTDFYIGGAMNEAGALMLQQRNGTFTKSNQPAFDEDRASEDEGSVLFDADKDGDLDLYVTSGSCENAIGSFGLADRLYYNSGGVFKRSPQMLPVLKPQSTSVVRAGDVDKDGDIDLFVGGRLRSDAIGVPVDSYLLINDGKGNFKSDESAPLNDLGMVSDALLSDFDMDGDLDLVIVGQWMPVTIIENNNGKFSRLANDLIPNSHGLWNTIATGDFNKDGYPDYVAGNLGLNARFKASPEQPVVCYVNDFDGNGSVEQVLEQFNGDTSYPLALRHDLVMQLPSLKKKYLRYQDYKLQTITNIFPPEKLKSSVVLKAQELQSVLLLSNGKKGFDMSVLPREAQVSCVYALLVDDFDGDGNDDIMAGGNLYGVKPEVGRYDASRGLILKGNGAGVFTALSPQQSGLLVEGEIRDIQSIQVGTTKSILLARNNETPVLMQKVK